MNEDSLSLILAATFRGNNEEVKNGAKILDSCFTNPIFPNLLFSIIKNPKYEMSIRKSASIQVFRFIYCNLISQDLILLFSQEFSNVVESSERELSPILVKCSNQLIYFMYLKKILPSETIFQLLSRNCPKSSLFYANSFMKIILYPKEEILPLYTSFTSNYIPSLRVFLQTQFLYQNENLENSQIERKKEISLLIFHFLSRATTYSLPDLFRDYSQLSFWMPSSMELFNSIHTRNYQYLKFLSNLPKYLAKKKSDPNYISIIKELSIWACSNLSMNNNDSLLISLTMEIIYNLIKYDLFQFDQNFFIELLKTVILPNFNSDYLIDYNRPITKKSWKNPYNASSDLFDIIIQKNDQFLNTFYSLFQSTEFIQSDFFASALDLYSSHVKTFFELDSSQFFSFLNQLKTLIENSIQKKDVKIVCLKIFSKLDSRRIQLPNEFLLSLIYFSLSNLFNEDSIVRYFAALSSSSLLSRIEKDERLLTVICENTPIVQRMNDLFEIFFQLERDYQTQNVTSSLKRIIFFFGKKIQPFLYQITNEVVGFFFFFASNLYNKEPSVLLSSIITKLIEISEGDAQYAIALLSSILDGEKWSNVCHSNAFDELFQILTSLIYHCADFVDEFCQIIPFAFNYLSGSENNNRLFSDIFDLMNVFIWKRWKFVTQIERINSIDSILINFLNQFIQSCNFFNEWIICASLSIKIDTFAQSYEMSFVFPKLLSFIADNSLDQNSISYVYDVVEHMFANFPTVIFSNDENIVNFLFNQIFIQNAKYPSFVDSFLRCFSSLPNEYKTVAFQKVVNFVNDKYSIENCEEEEEDDYEADDEIYHLKWFDECDIMNRFVLFCYQFCNDFQDFPGRENLLSLLSVIQSSQSK